ncbi:hypothetical protein HBB16_07980 [Pseudonocardia sp. MCCB 268]|nr:hypothetical protein [Pseudonocardia cytotoxica]
MRRWFLDWSLRARPPDLDEVFRLHADRLWSVALRMLGDPAEAEDAVQEAFRRAAVTGFRSVTPPPGRGCTGSW